MPDSNEDAANPEGIAEQQHAEAAPAPEQASGESDDASSASSQPSGVAMIARLRAEAEAAEEPTRRAVLLHEAAELEERAAGDELGAAREYLAAYNLDAAFREPLEALVRILERRRSLKNLGRVLDSLSKSAESSEERARALRARATDAADVQNDRVEARDLLEQAVEAEPSDATAWLMLELDAGMRGDNEGRKRALARRVELADPRWGGLLRVDLAELRASEGDVDDALDVLTEVVTSPDEAAWRACEVAERLARGADKGDREAWALVQRAEIVIESVSDPPGPRGRGVPAALRRGGVAADAFVRAAAAYRGVGRIEDEIATLERAVEIDPGATMPQLARIAAATRLGDLERAGALARTILERGARAELSPHLWLTVAESALARGDRDGVLDACGKLLAVADAQAEETTGARTALVAKTLLVDLLLDGSDPPRLAQMMETDAAARPTDEGKARGYMQAAAVWSLFAADAQGAKAALTQAVMHGADPHAIARLSRSLSASTPTAEAAMDGAWYDEASRRLRGTSKDPIESSDVDIDVARTRLARGDRDGARQALEQIQPDAPRSLLSRVMRVTFAGDAAGDELLASLSAGAEGEAAVAFAVARAVRAVRREEEAARSAAIDALASASTDDEIAALTRATAAIKDRPAEAAAVLRDLSRTVGEPIARDVLRVAAAVLLARGGATDVSLELVDELETEAQRAMAPARAVWARLIAKSDEDKRREAMEATAREVMMAGGWTALERSIDRLVAPDSGIEGPGAEELLSQLSNGPEGSLARAGLLLQASWPEGGVSPDIREQALRALEGLGPDAARMVARAELRKAHREGDSTQSLIAAEAWHRAGAGTPAAIEMMLGAELSADSEGEVRARSALARSLSGGSAQLIAASASMSAHVAGLPPPPIPTQRDAEVSAALALAELELSPPGSDPSKREHALRGMTPILPAASATLHELAAWSALARSDHASARALFARSLELAREHGEEPRSAIEGAVETELLANGGKPSAAWASLLEQLANVVEASGDVPGAATLWEQVGHAWWDALGDAARGERALSEAFARDNKRRGAFDRVFRAVRARKEDDKLLTIVGKRLEATDDPPEMAKLFWEQARVLRAKGDRDGALSSLENVTMLEPDHVGALALSAEIYVGRQMYEEAANALDRLSRQPVPVQQKLGAGLGAADLYETKLDRPDQALEVLVALDKAGLSDVAIHERIAKAAAKAQAWVPATAYLEKLVSERPSSEGRIEAARLAAAIYRDRLDDPQAALPALISLLRESPDDADALEQLLDAEPGQQAHQTLVHGLEASRAILAQRPADARYARITARIADLLGHNDLVQVALGVLGAIGASTPQERNVSTQLIARLGSAPAVALDADGARRLVDPEEGGPILQLFKVMGPTIAEALGPTLDAIGVGRKERVDARAQNPLRNEVATWAGALGIAEFEFYQGGRDQRIIQGVPGETPALVVGSSIRTPLPLPDRARLVREIVALDRGTTIVNVRDDVAVAAIIVATCALVEVPLKTPTYAVLAETQKLLGKAISRKTKKLLPEVAAAVARQLGSGGGDLRTFRVNALRTLDRAALLATGDPAAVLAGIVGEGASAAKIASDPRAAALLRFAWTDDYLALRRQLGLGIG